jgi:hypothetical protein
MNYAGKGRWQSEPAGHWHSMCHARNRHDPGGTCKMAPKTVTIDIVASFPNPWKGSISKEIAAMRAGAWAPSSDDFAAAVKTSTEVEHFYQMIGIVLKKPKGSVQRVNIYTHSNPFLIAFKGKIVPHTTFAEVLLNIDSSLSHEALQKLTPSTWFMVGKSKKKYTFNDVRERFTKNAKVFFYSCKSGVDALLLQDFANLFQVTAVGFKDNICFCPTYTGNRINRQHYGLGRGCQHSGTNFLTIDGQGSAHKPKPKP